MPLFEIEGQDALVPFRQLHGGAELYESEIEDLVWANFEELTGEALFRVARQATLAKGGRPDVIALDADGRVVVVEIKRDVDRGQLAQCLEYAGWARTTNLDELAGLYHSTPEGFFADWQEFTESEVPVRIHPSPRLLLVARDFHGRTGSAFEYLIEHNLPVKWIRVSLYEDEGGRKFVDVEGEHEPAFAGQGPADSAASDPTRVDGRRVRISDLLEANLLHADEGLVWRRPKRGEEYHAAVATNGEIRLDDGRRFATPSGAAMAAANLPSYDGWHAWYVERSDDACSLHTLRKRLAARQDAPEPDEGDASGADEVIVEPASPDGQLPAERASSE
jgi:hypothetical protein